MTNVFSCFDITGMNINKFQYKVDKSGIQPSFYDLYEKTPYDFYKLMITDDYLICLYLKQTFMLNNKRPKVKHPELAFSRNASSVGIGKKWNSSLAPLCGWGLFN